MCFKKREFVTIWVEKTRERLNIATTSKRKWEPSCEMFGEYNNLLAQLLTTDTGMGVWEELDCDDVLNMVYERIQKEEK